MGFVVLSIFSVGSEMESPSVFVATVADVNVVYESSVDFLLVPEDVCEFFKELVVFSAPEKDVAVQPVAQSIR